MKLIFADHLLDTDARELRRGRDTIALEPQVLDLLVYLVQNRDRVVSKDDLIASVWGGRIVSDATLTSRVYAARKAIGDSGQEQKLIRTIPRKGLRFVEEVRVKVNGHDAAVPATDPACNPIQHRLSQDRPAIAVLAFSNMSGDPGQEHFSDGISEDLTTALSKLRWFHVVERNSAFVYKGKAVHIKQIAEELGVGYVVEGSVRKAGGRMRITAQLTDTTTGSHIWAEHFDRPVADTFAVQDEITEAIVASIEPQLYAAENLHSRRKPRESMDAWELVMRAMSHYWRVTREDNLVAQALLEKAVAIDPNYGQAHGVLAASHIFGAHNGWTDVAAAIPIAARAARAAVQADAKDAWARLALGCVHLFARSFEEALGEFELALRLNPSFSLAQSYYGLALAMRGHWRGAAEAVERALRLSPRDPFSAHYYGVAAYAQFVGRNYDEAMRLARKAIHLRSDFAGGHRVLTAAAGMAGASDAAAAALVGLRRAHPDVSLAWIEGRMLIEHDTERRHYMEAFRRAGLS